MTVGCNNNPPAGEPVSIDEGGEQPELPRHGDVGHESLWNQVANQRVVEGMQPAHLQVDLPPPDWGEQANDPAAGTSFTTFFEEMWPWSFRLATLLSRNPSRGEEIAQEAMTGLYRRWDSVDQPKAYLRAAIYNAAKNAHRNETSRNAKLPLLVSADRIDFVAPELSDAVARLPFRQRAVIVFRYYADLKERDIADALGCRPGTVKSLASRALAQLAKEISR